MKDVLKSILGILLGAFGFICFGATLQFIETANPLYWLSLSIGIISFALAALLLHKSISE